MTSSRLRSCFASSLAWSLASGLSALTACTPEPVILPVRNLERPSDIAFACVHKVSDGMRPAYLTGRAMSACHDPAPTKFNPTSGRDEPDPRSARADHPLAPTGERVFGTFGFITNTARGEVAVAHFPGPDPSTSTSADGLVDLDPTSPGFNHIPVGSQPESIAVSDDSCRAVTANRGSCDLSVIDVPSVLARFLNAAPATIVPDTQKPVPPATQLRIAGLRAQPRELALLPSAPRPPTRAVATEAPVCSVATSHEVVVTFPRCSLVAVVEVPTGQDIAAAAGKSVLEAKIKSSLKFMPDGTVVDAGTNPVCPIECGYGALPPASEPGPVDAGPVDAGAPDGGVDDGGVPARPVGNSGAIGGLAVMPDGSALFVGLVEAPYVIRIGIDRDAAGKHTLVPQGQALALAEDAGGVTRLRLSVDPFAEPGDPSALGREPPLDRRFVGDRGEFLYAIARDDSVRVINIQRPTMARPTTALVECDANVDPSAFFTKAGNDPVPQFHLSACVPIGAAPRNVLAQGPGVRVPATRDPDIAPPVPIDIAFVQNGLAATGLLLASNGQIFHLALGGAPEVTDNDVEQTHWFRRAPPLFNQSRAGNQANVTIEPTRNFTSDPVERALPGGGALPFATKVSFPSRVAGPRLESFDVGMGSNTVRNWVYFNPTNTRVPPQSVSLEWQGVLTGFPRITGQVERPGMPKEGEPEAFVPDPAKGEIGALSDLGANFCRAGVEVGDLVTLIGCDQDNQCDSTREEVCHRAAPGAPGVCVSRELAMNEERLRLCRTEFTSRRRYEVRRVLGHKLMFGLKVDEVPRPGVAPCNPGAVPGSDEDVCQPQGSGHGPDGRVMGDVGFVCKVFASGAPRCVKPCARETNGVMEPDDTRCRPGHVCAGGPEGFLCVEAPPPREECLSGDLRYAVQVGKGFLVSASGLPAVSKYKEDDKGTCVELPGRNPLLQDRIPLDGPLCTKPPQAGEANNLALSIGDAGPAPGNPCFYQAVNNDETGQNRATSWKALFENPHMRFVLANVDTYIGDAGFVSFQVLDAFAPLRVLSTGGGSDVALGERIVTGPMASAPVEGSAETVPVAPYLFLIDQGRTTVELSRGQLSRINPRPWNRGHEGGRLDSQNTDSRFPIQ